MDKEKEIKNKPLTVEELKALKIGDWVWAVDTVDEGCYGYSTYRQKLYKNDFDGRWLSDYGDKWVAYKNKEEAEGAGYGNVENAINEFAEKLKANSFEVDTKEYGRVSVVGADVIDDLKTTLRQGDNNGR